MSHRSVCVYCGTAQRIAPAYHTLAGEVGRMVARRRIRLVYGGNTLGMTGELADGALAEGGQVTGVIPAPLFLLAHRGIDDLRIATTMHARKKLMAQESDAFVALPGGYGTLDELFEVATWRQIRLHDKPIALLNTDGFYDAIVAWRRNAVEQGFVSPFGEQAIEVLPDLDALGAWLDRIPAKGSWRAPTRTVRNWVRGLRDGVLK